MDDKMVMRNGWKFNHSIEVAGTRYLPAFCIPFLVMLYLSVPLIARYQEDMTTAIRWYPWDTEAKLALLSESEDIDRVNQLANEILQQNETCSLAYYAKAMVANCNNNYKKMIQYQKESIARNYFSHEVYLNYAYMLYDGISYATETNNGNVYAMCQKELNALPQYMHATKRMLGKLGKMITDQPDLEIDDEMQKIIELGQCNM